jgi:two-component system KDP operon response regulator KdpE
MTFELLIIDDDEGLTELLGNFLKNQGYHVLAANNGKEGIRFFFEHNPALVILDVTMPRRDGWGVLERIREMSDVPVIMLTARGEEENILRGFDLGADDYVTKPFSFAQLAARIGAVLNRADSGKADLETKLIQGDLEVDIPTKRVWRNKELIHLTPTEFKLLVALVRKTGEIVTLEELVKEAWGEEYIDQIGYVRRYVWHLRKKIEPDPETPRYIHNERGFGYRFQPPENQSPE